MDDGHGGFAEQHYILSVIAPPPNRPPVFLSTPVVQATATMTVGPPQLFNLSRWSPVQFDLRSPPFAQWVLGDSNSIVTQVINSDPAILLSDEVMTNVIVQGSFQVRTNYDDDYIGFVFGYQDPQHFYVFEWGQGEPTGEPPQRQMRIRTIHSPVPLGVGSAFVFQCPSYGYCVTNEDRLSAIASVLYTNGLGWADNIEYRFALTFQSGLFTIAVLQGTSTVASVTLSDSTYGAGKFGFYNWSQEQVLYTGFTRQSVQGLNYTYDADANDPDGDVLTYSLGTHPDGMAIDPATGLIRWSPTVAHIGTNAVTVLVSDGRGGTATQSYTILVRPDPANHPPIIISQPVTNAATGLSYIYDVDAVDPDGDQLTYSLSAGPPGMTIDTDSGVVYWVPPRTSLDLKFLPSVQGWSYATMNQRSEADVFRVGTNANGEPTLFQNTIGVGLPGSDHNRYELSSVLDPALSAFNLRVRAAVKAEEFQSFRFGFSFYVGYGGSSVGVGIGTNVIQVIDALGGPRTIRTGLYNTGYHDYVVTGTVGPGGTWNLSYDGVVIGSGSLSVYSGSSFLHLGDGTAGANARAEVTHYTFTQGNPNIIVRVEDGRGGFDTQSFVINVSPGGTAEIHGTVFNDLNGNGSRQNNNLVFNGDFSLGNVGFVSNYGVSTNLVPAGLHSVNRNTTNVHPGYPQLFDHSDCDDLMMIVNGAGAGAVVWQQDVPVSTNTDYLLSIWAAGLSPCNPARLHILINGVQVTNDTTLLVVTQWINLKIN